MLRCQSGFMRDDTRNLIGRRGEIRGPLDLACTQPQDFFGAAHRVMRSYSRHWGPV